ncbi:AEC family transporter [Saccharothrix variisporea]|uniref:Uncharacterized protein n=1 Tax=Saccharothrix variisporea TaxID=543527 RepID=A0A495XBP0_9PSEU|nr:hypothetical protein [Saccharothrix variisporea]RKT71407.1 hypothetical protein DFJ66_4696 [Saccharothrix variisporea]
MQWKPWEVAERLFRPEGDPSRRDRLLQRLTWWRSLLGLVTVVVLGAGDRTFWQALEEEAWQKASKNVVLAFFLVPVSMLVVYLLTERPRRRAFTLWPVARKLVLLAVTAYGLMAPIILVATGTIPRDWVDSVVDSLGVLKLPLGLFILGYGLWVAVYLGCTAFWASRTSCWSGEFHPLLAPTVTAVVVTTFTVVTLVENDTKGVDRDLWLFLTFGGLATTLALALAEYVRLRRDGYRWRTGPLA